MNTVTLPAPTINVMPINFFPPKAESKVEEKIRRDEAITEVRRAITKFLYEG